jgi:hypothetical protein
MLEERAPARELASTDSYFALAVAAAACRGGKWTPIVVGKQFPDLRLPDHAKPVRLSSWPSIR